MKSVLRGCCCWFGLVGIWMSGLADGAWADGPKNLAEAVRAGSAFDAEWFLRQGAAPNQLLDEEPLLVRAAEQGNLELCRVLILHGADVRATNRSGQPLHELVPKDSADGLLLPYFLRTFRMLEAFRREPQRSIPGRPHLVTLYEPTVDYLHPQVQPFYYFNQAELEGREGVDDDQDGFIDNSHGWVAHLDRPFQLNLVQRHTWHEYGELIEELAELHNRSERGELFWSDPPLNKLANSYRNPVAALFGNHEGYSDAEFLAKLIQLSHGTHVAGTVIRSSQNKALVHTVSWMTFGDLDPGPDDLPPVTSGDHREWLRAYRSGALEKRIQKGRRGSDFVRAIQSGVVNGSFSSPLETHVAIADSIWNEMTYYNSALEYAALQEMAQELYAYHAIPYVVAAAENPEVLFVVAAGNANEDIDLTGKSPACLSRFFPNVLTVAACDSAGSKADFSNYGMRSVSIAAPGVAIESDGVAGCRLLMSGTSMATPAVSGIAARCRAEFPDLSAIRLAQLIQLSIREPVPEWAQTIAAGGTFDEPQVIELLRGTSKGLQKMAWDLYPSDPQRRPEVWATGIELIESGTVSFPTNALLWQAAAALYDRTSRYPQALAAIDRAMALNRLEPAFWRSKCLLLNRSGNYRDLLTVVDEFESTIGSATKNTPLRLDIIELGWEAALRLGEESAQSRLFEIRQRLQRELGRIESDCVITQEASGPRVSGRLTATQSEVRLGFSGQKDLALRIDLSSSDFDTRLKLRGPADLEWENDDSGLDGTNSRLELTLPEAGDYCVEIRSYSAGSTGEFALSIDGPDIRLSPIREPLRHFPPGD